MYTDVDLRRGKTGISTMVTRSIKGSDYLSNVPT